MCSDKTDVLAAIISHLLVVFALLGCAGPQDSAPPLTIRGNTMGTTFTVKIADEYLKAGVDNQTLDSAINKLLEEVNRQMSTYLPDSEISTFNQSSQSDWFGISDDFAKVLQQSLLISEMSGGAFDITVGALVDLWGFGPGQKPPTLPADEVIDRLKARIGYQKISVRLAPPAAKKTNPDIHCDLSAIAKGFGVDKVAEYLQTMGVSNYMVEIGGEVRTKGFNASGQTWRIGVESPDTPSGIEKVLAIRDRAMATSGDYFNYFEVDGVRYSHTIDPRTGRPITHKLASVTVIHSSCTLADGLATAINVLGPEAGYEFAQQRELAIYMIVREGDGFGEKMTPQFEKFLAGSN